ncbi:MAG: ornithine carbamoyltransferase [Lentisphaerae bacterium GWF2_45_14]|nr:MAG: ornithine carbamoyltransferase [Lentisphaerae bacterium GWF2_45_14]
MHQNLLTLEEITHNDLREVFKLSQEYKENRGRVFPKPLEGKSIGMIFSKSSTRTRVSFDVGIYELGGHGLYMEESKMQVGRGETIADTACVLSRYLHGIVIRTFKHSDVVELAKHSRIPVINALTDEFHPCQTISDLFTIHELSDSLEGVKITYLGDGASNMANSLILAAKFAGMELIISSPHDYQPRKDLMDKELGHGSATWEPDPVKAVENAAYLYTDVWVSMGFEDESAERVKKLKPYQLNMQLLRNAAPDAKVMHCLPAHREEEITSEVVDSPQSIVLDQAENRLHVQKAILTMMIGQN